MDPKDAIREARLRLRKLAASALVESERLSAEKARLEETIRLVHAEPESEEARQLLEALNAERASVDAALQTAWAQQAEAEEESRALTRLEPELERAEVRRIAESALGRAIDDRSPERVALENVRHHVDQLEAEASLGALGVSAERARDQRPAPPDPRAQLEALKAARANRSSEADPQSPAPSPKPKRTM